MEQLTFNMAIALPNSITRSVCRTSALFFRERAFRNVDEGQGASRKESCGRQMSPVWRPSADDRAQLCMFVNA